MGRYIVNRLMQGLLLVFVVTILVFAMLHMMPGDPIDLLSARTVPQEQRQLMRQQYGLDKPFIEQYFNWLKNLFSGDMGRSIKTRMPVSEMFAQRIPVTLKLCGIALLIELAIALPIGLLAAYKKDSIFDRIVMSLSLLFAAVPSFWLAMMLIMLFGVTLKVLPLSGFIGVQSYLLPIAAMVLGTMASTIRLTKTEVLDVMREKYILTAYAKGLPHRIVMVRHVLRNALILVTIMLFLNIPWVISGAVIIENIFVIPGMGSLMTASILVQDFTVVQACVLIIAVLTVLCNLICDIITAVLDPRIRISLTGSGN